MFVKVIQGETYNVRVYETPRYILINDGSHFKEIVVNPDDLTSMSIPLNGKDVVYVMNHDGKTIETYYTS